MFTSKAFSLIVALLGLLCLQAEAQYSQCSLCASPGQLPVASRWSWTPPGSDKTCQETYVYLSTITTQNSFCGMHRGLAQNFCCNAGSVVANSVPAPAPTIPAYVGPIGPEPVCPICRTNEFPGIPSGFIVARYVGEYTCEQLYGRGLHGMIPNYMCGPLQDFAQPVCGCGIYNPRLRQSSGTTAMSLTAPPQAQSTYNANPGGRNLRGSSSKDEEDSAAEVPPPSVAYNFTAEDFHFETRPNPEVSNPEVL